MGILKQEVDNVLTKNGFEFEYGIYFKIVEFSTYEARISIKADGEINVEVTYRVGGVVDDFNAHIDMELMDKDPDVFFEQLDDLVTKWVKPYIR